MGVKTIGEFEGKPVLEAMLTNESGVQVSIMSYGASVRDWKVPVGNQSRSVVLGYETFAPYAEDPSYLGAIIGRVANRIANAEFKMDGKTYRLKTEGTPYILHGGPHGIGRRNWDLKQDGNAVHLKIDSPANENGFPGEVNFSVTYRLEGYQLEIEMRAEVSEQTPISMVQHNYFNLMGAGDVLDHSIQIRAEGYTVLNENLVTTGEILPTHGSRYDFSIPKNLREEDGAPGHYDINLVLENQNDPVVNVVSPDKALSLQLWTDRPGVQLYNGIHLNFRGVCFEDQMFPNAVNQPSFPSIFVDPKKPYIHKCAIEIRPL